MIEAAGQEGSGVPGEVSKQSAPASKADASKPPSYALASNIDRAEAPKVAPHPLFARQHGARLPTILVGALHVSVPQVMGGAAVVAPSLTS